MNQEKNYRIEYGELLNRCWKDPKYLAKFRENPAAVLEDFGIPTVPGARYHVVNQDEMKPSTTEDIYLPYMEKPKTRELSIEDVDDVAGGGWFITSSNVVVNGNVAIDGAVAVESIAAAVTVSVAAAVG